MRKVFNLVLTLFICLFGLVGIVNAEEKCSSQRKNELSKAANAITASYDFIYDDERNVTGFSINIYNVPNEMSISYSTSPSKYNKSGGVETSNGFGNIVDTNTTDVYTYNIDIYSSVPGCAYKIKTLKVTKPKRNEYSKSVYCLYSELENHTYCQEWITKNIDKSFDQVEDDLKKALNKTTTTVGTSVCVNCNEIESAMFNMKDFFKKNKMVFIVAIVLAIILDIFTIVLMIKNSKEGEL
jgi:hypothetical protein